MSLFNDPEIQVQTTRHRTPLAMTPPRTLSRLDFLSTTALALAGSALDLSAQEAGPLIDIHQHTNYRDRNNAVLLAHQRAMGVTHTILLPAGREVSRPSTGDGKYNGLGGVKVAGNAAAAAMAKQHPKEFLFGANEVTDLPEARAEIEKHLQAGAVIIGEQKFHVECDSQESQALYELAAEYRVPILLHFQHETYNLGFDRFHTMLEKHPKTVFIGHAQTWWSGIDKHADPRVLYPNGPVTPGGITDRLLADYPNIYADMSAGSGLQAMTRDEEHARGFLERHQDKLLYGSDCLDHFGRGPGCLGAQIIALVRRLAPSKAVERKILFDNAKKLFRIA
jgi:predicted TIM-barrel fold metal-dependent hydrolase